MVKEDKLPTKAMAAKVDPACWPDGITDGHAAGHLPWLADAAADVIDRPRR